MEMRNLAKKIFVSLMILVFNFFFVDFSLAADISASISRSSGVSPLAVNFNADLNFTSESEESFHNYEYAWDFDDSESGNWGTSSKSKNFDKGPVAAHIYESPGVYDATLTVKDLSGTIIDSEIFTITVIDPETVYAGDKTTCISTASDFTNCPAGANQVTTSDLAVLTSYTDAGERVLLKRGEAWTVSSNISFPNNNGPVTIGAFGSCPSSDELGICSNAPNITVVGLDSFLNLNNKRDWRIMDISFSEANGNSTVVGGGVNIKDGLIFRLKTDGFSTPIGWTHWRYNEIDYIENMTVASSRIENFNSNGFYVGSEKLVLLGNIVRDCSTSHVVRVWQSYVGVIGHNIFSGSSLDNSNGRHALKFHGPIYGTELGTFAQTSNGGLRRPSALTVVHNNIFGTSGPWPVYIGPQDSGSDERLYDIIFEKNKIIADYGNLSPMTVQVSLTFSGRYMTARNNIIDGSESANGYTGISINRRGIEWTPVGNRAYNNTIYNPETNSNGVVGIFVGVDATDTEIRNNLISYPNGIGPKAIIDDDSGISVMSNNLLTDSPGFIDSNNATPLSRNFDLLSNSSSINQGYANVVFDDFNGNSRRGVSIDLGAFEYDSGDVVPPTAPTGLGVI